MPTIADVAKAAGVSKSAVSRVIGGKESTVVVSDATRRRILDAARELKYVPNPLAVALSTGRTYNIGLLVHSPMTFLTHPNGALQYGAFVQAAGEKGYRIAILWPDASRSLESRMIDGCIVYGTVSPELMEMMATVARQVPVLSTNVIPGATTVRIEGQVEEGFRMAAHYLYDLGHRSIVTVEITDIVERQAEPWFRTVAGERNLRVELTAFVDPWEERVYPTIERIVSMRPLPTAIYAFDDDYARALIARLARDGVRVPEDVSVFSRETHKCSHPVVPMLTGVDWHFESLPVTMIQRLVEFIEGKERADAVTIMPAEIELVVRESCTQPRGGTPAAG